MNGNTAHHPSSGLWIVVREARAWDVIGWDDGPFRIKGGKAVYQAVSHNCSTARSNNVKLARLGDYDGTECRGLREVSQFVGPDTILEFLQPNSAPLRKPNRSDLIALLTWAAHEIGGAHADHANDRDPNGFEKAQERLTAIQDRLRDAAGRFPYPRKSPWTTPPKPKRE